ncbi:minor head protein [Bacillus phage Wip1]|uniref:Putative major capsid protein n=1 Tax=Bacillus phage Wip1 TaxID=663237 RepID=S5Z7D7_9VIRU|nr:minor head protein [Bacillus phage Wip1]AGT13371.1 putative major capsid protein [Bacillus phage Wip1]
MAEQQISAQARAANFATATRQNYQMLPSQQVREESSTIEFTLPKARLLSKIILNVEAVATLKSKGTAIQTHDFTPYPILRRVSLDLNNGFSPFIVSGRDLVQYNMLRLNPNVLFPSTNPRAMNYVENGASPEGKDAKIKFSVELPITLNPRDPVGLILLQNPETSVTLTVDVETLAKAYSLNASNADQVLFKSMKVTPMLEAFNIPPVPQAFPDISTLKLVSSKSDTFSGNGQNILKLNTGTIYRKLILFIEDKNGNPLADEDFQGNLELVFNQADIPYSIKPEILAHINHSQLGYALPKGMYAFDFTNQGIPNLGGSRDFIDTERLTEFWLRFSTQKEGKVTVVSENLSRLR